MEKIILNVVGMSCNHCVHTIREALDALPGVDNINVSLDAETVEAEVDVSKTPIDVLKDIIAKVGYEVK